MSVDAAVSHGSLRDRKKRLELSTLNETVEFGW
jgi:hypothetical protein